MAKNTLKINEDEDSKQEAGYLFVKVITDDAPYLRKINLRPYGGYVELSSTLEKMYSGFTVGMISMSFCFLSKYTAT